MTITKVPSFKSLKVSGELLNFGTLELLNLPLMRKQIAAANWKMNLTIDKAEKLLDEISAENLVLSESGQVVFAVPFPYLMMAAERVKGKTGYAIAAQNCSNKKSGADYAMYQQGMIYGLQGKHGCRSVCWPSA